MTSKALEAAILFMAKDTAKFAVNGMRLTQQQRDGMEAKIDSMTLQDVRADADMKGIEPMVAGCIRAFAENMTNEEAAECRGVVGELVVRGGIKWKADANQVYAAILEGLK